MKRVKLPKMTSFYLGPVIQCINRLLAPEGLRLRQGGYHYISLERLPHEPLPRPHVQSDPSPTGP